METNKKLLANAFLSLVGIVAFSLAVMSRNENVYRDVRGEYTPYSIVLETNKNKIGVGAFSPTTTYSGNGFATTELGNQVAFEYNELYNPINYWQTIKAGGYITNTQPITGMSSITLTKENTDANFGIFWSSTTTFTGDRYKLFDTSSPLLTVCNFNGYLPNYIKIVAIADSSITSGLIEFSCVDNYPVEKGKTSEFGLYPQSKVEDSTLITTLNNASGTLPTSANSQAWTSYGYYISDSSATSYMWYIDLMISGDEYRGVYFTSYRPYYTSITSSTDNSYQDDNGYTTSNVYWFKYEPITWRVLDVQGSSAFLMADLVLDSQDYHYSWETRTIGGVTVYSNNYEHSHIRSWLNDTFYNTAFNAAEKARILTTTVDNSVASTGYSTNQYACANTSDKVFLLSYAEATSATYGLNTDASRQLQPSAYAKAQGVYTYTNGFNLWWLRSPSYDDDCGARYVSSDGNVIIIFVDYTYYGVVPALWISL